MCRSGCSESKVEAYVASWIEILYRVAAFPARKSRLMLPRGLKCCFRISSMISSSRGLCCLVDWNVMDNDKTIKETGRGLCCLVDWNSYPMITPPAARGSRLMLPRGLKYIQNYTRLLSLLSRLMLPRGLKCWMGKRKASAWSRGLCCLVDWNRPGRPLRAPAPVEAYVASWIETFLTWSWYDGHLVEVYTASWMEILM